MVLSWSASQPTFQLQSRTNLTQGGWSNVSTQPVLEGNQLKVTLPGDNGATVLATAWALNSSKLRDRKPDWSIRWSGEG